MKMYNIYYKGNKVNRQLLSGEDVYEILQHENIYKRNQYTHEKQTIPVSSLQIVECIVV